MVAGCGAREKAFQKAFASYIIANRENAPSFDQIMEEVNRRSSPPFTRGEIAFVLRVRFPELLLLLIPFLGATFASELAFLCSTVVGDSGCVAGNARPESAVYFRQHRAHCVVMSPAAVLLAWWGGLLTMGW